VYEPQRTSRSQISVTLQQVVCERVRKARQVRGVVLRACFDREEHRGDRQGIVARCHYTEPAREHGLCSHGLLRSPVRRIGLGGGAVRGGLVGGGLRGGGGVVRLLRCIGSVGDGSPPSVVGDRTEQEREQG
jgi:hypothetical protein